MWSSQIGILGRSRPGSHVETVERAGLDALGPMFRVIALADDGQPEAAAQLLGGFSIDDVPPSPDDRFIILAADALAAAGTDRERARAYDALLSLSGLQSVVGGCVLYAGAVDHRLGLLAHALGRTEAAVAHLEAAIEQEERLGAAAWAALSRAALARVRPAGPQFRRDGEVWTLTFQARTVTVRDSKGLRDLAALVGRPGEAIHAFELLGRPRTGAGADAVLDDRSERPTGPGCAISTSRSTTPSRPTTPNGPSMRAWSGTRSSPS